ncbi:ABC transporter ATP-binding protein [Ammoniphilus sp. YIM 78166]|uniref:ABC transporter ATP-binding protein n=1 Tax=Ammoniphilus sp. YIM 78166 TaxID=1644106 RepID=UPI00106F248F|nr:ABC transporter ATP-binding protein [Ammoniphilus sp. YIM 78166]
MLNPVLRFDQVHFEYREKGKPAVPVLQGLNLAIHDGEFVSVIGPSGSGKTTLFRLITGLEQPNVGSIHLNGKKQDQRLGQVGYMPQQDLLMPWRTVLDNAALPLELKGVSKENAHRQVSELLVEFGLAGVGGRYPSDLSGGMRQRVSFLRSILSGSSILLLDEPFSALDAITRLTMQEWLLEQWKKWKKTILFITHDVDEAMFLSDRILVFSDRPVQAMQEWTVPLSRPRTIRDLSQEKILLLKEQLIDQLRVNRV